MKTIYFVRHAKASWDYPELRDIQRPLLDIGKKRTKKVIHFLSQKGVLPDLIITSPATRAFETAKLLSAGLKYKEDSIIIEQNIYDGGEEHILNIIYGLPDQISSVMIVGHNPTITHLINLFAKPGVELLPTAGVASITFNTGHWEKIHESEANQDFIIYPKML
jgi:phosphohistidine phosphatase